MNIGVRADDRTLEDWPEEQIDRYLTVMETVNKWQLAQRIAAAARR